jgi:hypothetical protein
MQSKASEARPTSANNLLRVHVVLLTETPPGASRVMRRVPPSGMIETGGKLPNGTAGLAVSRVEVSWYEQPRRKQAAQSEVLIAN